jgi:hypothetical protein
MIETSPLDLTVTEEDFNIVAKKDKDNSLATSGLKEVLFGRKQKEEVPVDKRVEGIRKLLPSVIAKKIADVIPPDFDLTQMTLTGEVAGQPFGIGVRGEVSVVFEKKKNK